jgi:hypothetical protein
MGTGVESLDPAEEARASVARLLREAQAACAGGGVSVALDRLDEAIRLAKRLADAALLDECQLVAVEAQRAAASSADLDRAVALGAHAAEARAAIREPRGDPSSVAPATGVVLALYAVGLFMLGGWLMARVEPGHTETLGQQTTGFAVLLGGLLVVPIAVLGVFRPLLAGTLLLAGAGALTPLALGLDLAYLLTHPELESAAVIPAVAYGVEALVVAVPPLCGITLLVGCSLKKGSSSHSLPWARAAGYRRLGRRPSWRLR